MAVLTYDELIESVQNVARKYARKCSLPYEDFVQELWIWMLEKKPESLALARTQLVNHAIDLCRADWRTQGGMCGTDFSDPEGQVFVEENVAEDRDSVDDDFDLIISEQIIRSALKNLSDRERKYVIAKAYLACNINFFERDFMDIIAGLDCDERSKLMNSPKADTDDMILKVILKIKTGTNSGSIRSIKTNLRNNFRSVIIGF